LSESVQRYLAHQRASVVEEIPQVDDAYAAARAKRMQCLAAQEELALALPKGRLHRTDDVEHVLWTLLRSTRDKLLGVPSKCMCSLVGLTNATAAHQIVDDAIRIALTDLSKAKVSDFNGQPPDGAEPD
jgi:hypothetical protein